MQDDGTICASGEDAHTRVASIQSARAQVEAARLRREALVRSGQLPAASTTDSTPAPIMSLPGYTLLRELKRGGQGVVYLALQQSTNREVAVKVLRHAPIAHPAEIARFEREVEVLGGLKHGNIVTIHDCGRSGDDFFLVMDYVSGWSLDDYLALERPGVNETLALFAKICDGVNAAHLRGVIHRDLKPANILVDRDGEPRVLDFGLAKLADEVTDPSSTAAMTQTGQFVGSMPWASPEQAEGRSDLMDIRSDVYSLGVVLFQALTGRFPYPITGGISDVIHQIVETSPMRPSALEKSIGGEVETIVLKCLAKERERRYQSAGELARDIRHYLANEPIEARRDSLRYVLRKQLRRHWVAVAIGASFLVLLAAGLITSMAFWYRAEQALVEKEQQRKLAEQRADETQRVADFQYRMLNEIDVAAMGRGLKDHFREQVRAGLARKYVGEAGDSRLRTSDEIEKELAGFDQLTSAAHAADVARRVMDEFVLQPAVRTVREFSDQPRVQAHILDGLGRTYRVLGLFDAAESNYRTALAIRRRALGDQHLALAVNLNNVATLLVDKGDAGAVEPLLNEALAILRRNSEADPALMASVLRNLAIIRYQARDFDAAESKCLEALSLARQLPEQPNGEVPACLNVLSGVWEVRGRHDEAIASSKEAVAILRTLPIPQRRDLSSSLQNLAFLLSAAGDMNGAENLYREAWAMKRQLHGDEHPDVATSLNSLAFFLKKKGDAAAAEPLYREAIAIQRKTIGDEHPDVGNTLNNLAALLRDKGDFEAAEPLYRESISIQEKQSPSDSVNLAVGRGGFARVLMGLCADESIAPELRKSRLAEAEALLLLARETFEKTSGVPAQLAQSNLESLVKLHELLDRLEPNQNHAAELAEWRRRLERFNAESK